MAAPLRDHLRALGSRIAAVLGGRAVDEPRLSGFLTSAHDRFLNQLFASAPVTADEAAAALAGRPGFVWLSHRDDEAVVMHGMATRLAGPAPRPDPRVEIVRSRADLDDWHAVYAEVFGADPKSREEWRAIHDALGAAGDGSLALLLARVDDRPAATGAVFLDGAWAGLYCFTTRGPLRGRGLASALVSASHDWAYAHGVEQALLHATALGRPVYAARGYREVESLSVLVPR